MVLIVLTGAPGSGKSTLARVLEASFGVARVRPLTSRSQRPTEAPPANDYIHVDRSVVEAAILRREVAFSDMVANELYGVRIADLGLGFGHRSLILPVGRIPDIKRFAPTVSFFLSPAGGEVELERRLRERGETDASVERRMEWGRSDTAALPSSGVWHLGAGDPEELGEEVMRVVELETRI